MMNVNATHPMMDDLDSAPPGSSGADAPTPVPEASSANVRLVRIVSLLLLLQAFLLLGIAIWFIGGIDWAAESQKLFYSASVIDATALGFWFFVTGFVLAPTAIGFFFLRRTAWIIAMAIQVLLLVVTLTTYFFSVAPTLERSYRMLIIMASCVVMVFYLNLSGVRAVVQWRDKHWEESGGDHGTD